MRKALLVLLVVCGAYLALAVSASASVTVGLCQLTADNPINNGNGFMQAKGSLDCGSGPNTLEIEVCLEKNTGSGWSGTYNCHTVSADNAMSITTTSYGQVAGCGTWFRTWAWGDDKYTTGFNTYNRTGETIGNADYWC